MSLTTLLNLWHTEPNIAANIAAWRTFAAQPAQTRPFPPDLHPALADTLRRQGLDSLYSHQHTAWETIQAGQHPVIVTGTASGKSLCYNLPMLDSLLRDPNTRGLYLFPTKALARDQAESLQQLVNSSQPLAENHHASRLTPHSSLLDSVATYDGDTPAGARPTIRRTARVLITNPDMLHTGILPHHTRWADFFRHLRFVVIDEMHSYRGVFGSHIANLIRRLKRIARFYGATPQFILTSATIANPAELAERLIEEPVRLIDNDGAAKGSRHFLIYNPPIVNPEFGLRRSALQESVRLAGDLLAHQVQSLIFGRSRRTVEMLLKYLQEFPPLPPKSEGEGGRGGEGGPLRAYRSGYLPQQRREIEQGLRDGRVRVVAATSALELGIDIGGLGAVILTGYPGTIAGAWQQAGRAGRQQTEALAVLVASASPLDQFLAHHPDYFFDRSPEQALINPDHLLILLQHLRCAAFELPFRAGDGFGRVEPAHVVEFLRFLSDAGELYPSGDKFFWMADRYPAQAISLRSASPERVMLRVRAGQPGNEQTVNSSSVSNLHASENRTADHRPPTAEKIIISASGGQRSAVGGQVVYNDSNETWLTIGEVDRASAPWLVHPQAIYLHEGQSFVVENLDLALNIAYLRPATADYYTEPRRETTVELIQTLHQAEAGGTSKAYGELLVTTQVTGYKVLRWFTQERLGEGDLELPPSELQTTGYWLALAEATVERLRQAGIWRSDPNDYGPNWQQQRRRARARDGYRCQICGVPEQGQQHDIHHKIPFRTFASYQEANRLDNLVTLCRSCHRRAELTVKVRSGLSGLATVLGRLAPLFLMGDAHDLGIHSDPQSPLAEGRPTVIIYDAIPGGLGFSRRLFELHDDLLGHARNLVAACSCVEGCPSCVGPAGEQGQGGKGETLAILEALAL